VFIYTKTLVKCFLSVLMDTVHCGGSENEAATTLNCTLMSSRGVEQSHLDLCHSSVTVVSRHLAARKGRQLRPQTHCPQACIICTC